MAALAGAMAGGLAGIFLVSRLVLWALRRAMGDTGGRIALAHVLTFAFAVVAGGYGFAAVGQGPDFPGAALTYAGPEAFWLVVDLVAWRGRRVRGKLPRIEA